MTTSTSGGASGGLMWPGTSASVRRPRPSRLRFRRRHPHIDPRQAARYDAAMSRARRYVDELQMLRLAPAQGSTQHAEAIRAINTAIDAELARAIEVALQIHSDVFHAAGGIHRAEVDPTVIVWKSKLNRALTLRAQHEIAAIDDERMLVPVRVPAHARAAYGPQQAGLDFET